jgi:thiol-disulfide isomerase/thioredoxin
VSPARSALLVACLTAGCGGPSAESGPTPREPGPPEFTTPVPDVPPLKAGDVLPPLEAKGWVNGAPPVVGAAGQKLLVVDVWALWCPFCKSTAPNLVRLHAKYAPRGVQFVGLTNMPADAVDSYVATARIPWPNGYLIGADTITRLGAGSGMAVAGYQVAPTLYLAGPDGVVRWSDGRHRMRHPDPGEWERTVDAAIAAALDPPAGVP